MFGYVRPLVPQLKVMEYEMYRAVYCGLCRAMGRVTGQMSRLTLSYDFTLLAMVRMILEGVTPEFERFRCAAHPLKQRTFVRDNAVLEYAAAMSAVLAYLKNRDDLADERGLKKIRAMLADVPVTQMNRRGMRYLPETAADELACRMDVLAALEAAGCPSVDQAADAFGGVLAYVFALGLDGDAAVLAEDIGRHVGRFVYVCDAADDLPEDIRRGRYNPLAAGWGNLAVTADGAMTDLVKGSLEISLPLDLEGLGRAADRLNREHPLTPIVRNLVYLGLPASMRRVLYGNEPENGGLTGIG
ncbi:MAG: hypothetical protein E7579_10600 [Ruminococcaceae bacterium]|nr:hypothetical protein [Oscillospiraceae bacterium]